MGLKDYNAIQLLEKNLITFKECIEFIVEHEGISAELAFEWLLKKDFLFNTFSTFFKVKENIELNRKYNFDDYILTNVQNEEFIQFSDKYVEENSSKYAFSRFHFFWNLSNEFELSAQTRFLCFNIYHDLVDPQWLETKSITFFDGEFTSQDYCRMNFKNYNLPEKITEDEAACLLFGVQSTDKNFVMLKSGNLWISQKEFNQIFELVGFSHYGIKYNEHQTDCEMNGDDPFFREINLTNAVKFLIENVPNWTFPDFLYEIASKEKIETSSKSETLAINQMGNLSVKQTDPPDLETQIKRLNVKNKELEAENSLLRTQLQTLQTTISNSSCDEITNPMQKKAVAIMIGTLILKAFPQHTQVKGLFTHGLIEAVKNETGVTQTTAKTWIELAQEKLSK